VEDVLEKEENPRQMTRARRHHRILAWLAFGVLALAAEIIGRSLTHRFDLGRHVGTPSYGGADYYPMFLLAVKLAVALMLARLAWRFAGHEQRRVAGGASSPLSASNRVAPHASGSSSRRACGSRSSH
jgi:hypothetical protein